MGRELLDEREWRKEGAGSAALPACHQRLEGPPQHLRIHRGLAPVGRLLSRGESKLAEDIVNQRAVGVVGENNRRMRAFDRRPREQTAIEKGDAPERAGRGGPPSKRRVEGAEKEWSENLVAKSAP